MATNYPSSKQTFTDPAGTSLLTSPDHAGLHTDMNDTIEAMQDTVGTTAGTNVLKDFAAGQFPARVNAGGTIVQTLTGGTINSTTLGTATLIMGSDATGDMLYRAATGFLARVAIGTNGQYLTTDGTTPSWGTVAAGVQYTDTRFKVGQFTRDMTEASGTVTYTGVGFAPKVLIFTGVINTTFTMFVGFDDGTTVAMVGQEAANDWTYDTSFSIYLQTSAGVRQTAKVSSLDADGFKLVWTKTGSPTGTGQCFYLAYR